MDNQLYSPDSEFAVLSIIMKQPEIVHAVSGLRSYMFSSTAHRIIYEAIEDALAKNNLPEMNLIISTLDSKGTLSIAGGRDYIVKLSNQAFRVENFGEYVRIVSSAYKARTLSTISNNIDVSDLTVDTVDSAIGKMRRDLDSLLNNGAVSSTILLKETLKESYEKMIAGRSHAGIRGTSWGIQALDEHSGGKAGGDYWLFAGRPSQGKTALLCNAVLADGEANSPALVIEREMPKRDLVSRLTSIETGIPLSNILLSSVTDEQSEEILNVYENKFSKYPIYIDTDFRATDIYSLEANITKHVRLHGVKTVYIDYIQLLTERGDDQTAELGRYSRLFRLLANELDICIVVLSQLNRSVEQREDKRPILSDLRQSGNLEEDADFVLGLYRDEYYNKKPKVKNALELLVLKARNGPVGYALCNFDGVTNKISMLPGQ